MIPFFFFNSLDPSEFTIFILSTSLFQDWNLIMSLLWALHWFSILHRINLQFWRLASRALLSSLLLTFTMSPTLKLKVMFIYFQFLKFASTLQASSPLHIIFPLLSLPLPISSLRVFLDVPRWVKNVLHYIPEWYKWTHCIEH